MQFVAGPADEEQPRFGPQLPRLHIPVRYYFDRRRTCSHREASVSFDPYGEELALAQVSYLCFRWPRGKQQIVASPVRLKFKT